MSLEKPEIRLKKGMIFLPEAGEKAIFSNGLNSIGHVVGKGSCKRIFEGRYRQSSVILLI